MKNLNEVKKKCESLMGEKITKDEWEFALSQIVKDFMQVSQRVYDETAYDMIMTNIDFYRRHELCKNTTFLAS